MTKHGIFELPPRGLRWYCTDIPTCTGVWLPLPIYWLAILWLESRVAWSAHQIRAKAMRRAKMVGVNGCSQNSVEGQI